MRIVVYENSSVIIDSISVTLSPGDNTIELHMNGYVPGTLYITTEYEHSYIEMTNGTILLTIHNPDGNTSVDIPIVYTTNLVNGKVLYKYDNNSTDLIVNNIGDNPISGNIGIGSVPLYSDENMGGDVLEYSLIGEYTIDPSSTISIPLSINEDREDGVSMYKRYTANVDDDNVYMTILIERVSMGITRPPYPGELIISEEEIYPVTRDKYAYDIGIMDTISVSHVLDENSVPYIEIDNNESASIPITLIFKNDDTDIPDVQIISPNDTEISSTVERIGDELHISFDTNGIGRYTVLV